MKTPALLALALTLAASTLQAQEPATRAELLREQREEKAAHLSPPQPSRLERLLLDLENGRSFERLLRPAEGFYPKIGNVTAGSGFSLGPGFRHTGLLAGHADVSAFAAGSTRRYWMLDARVQFPRLANRRLSAEAHGQRYDFPLEDFFGIGPQSLRSTHSDYGLRNTLVGGSAAYHPLRWLSLGGGADYLMPEVDGGTDANAIARRPDAPAIPGLAAQPDFVRYQGTAEVNTRQPRGNPRAGGRYAVTVQRTVDRDAGAFSFNRVEADLQHYISLLRARRVIALHAFASLSDADAGADVPFYLQRTLGGPDDLRGFRRYRFRDRNVLLLQAEYRWEIFTAVDGAIFYDAGKVASRREDLTLRDLESDYGIGFRFGSANGVFLRVEGAFGSSGGKHFIMRWGHVF